MKTPSKLFVAAVAATALSACAKVPPAPASTVESAAAPIVAEGTKKAPGALAVLPVAIVHKTPSCGCCRLWVGHLQQAGFRVEIRDEDNLDPVKSRLGVPAGKGSCHTAEIGGYVIEGHVPAADIQRLLEEKPDARGLVLPGMPLGAPGMEVPDGTVQPYDVELVLHDGTTVTYASHGQ